MNQVLAVFLVPKGMWKGSGLEGSQTGFRPSYDERPGTKTFVKVVTPHFPERSNDCNPSK